MAKTKEENPEVIDDSEGQVIQVPFDEHMVSKFIPYAMDVITSRALPDARDGMKPVQRRILYSMYSLGQHPNTKYRKCAHTVGNTLGAFHPHGDTSVYDAMVVMAQDFKLRYPLVDGHGNFGSLDGDPAAAMRYTEARLSKYGELMLQDIDKRTVGFVPNYDDSSTEPSVLPGLFPNLLLNGSQGIAVGMSCNFLPHNAKDVYSAADLILANALKDKETSIDDIIKTIKAPDFPTGGVVYDLHEVHKAYREGHGRCMVRSKYHIEKYGRQKKDKDAIVIDEIPYGVNKSKLVLSIGKLAAESEDFIKIEHVRDESDRNGMRIVIELKKDTQTNIMINRLLKKTEMQKSLPIQCTALDNGKPKLNLNIKQLLELFLEHILEVLRNKAQYEYDKYGARLHIIEAYLKALEDTEKTISCLKTSSRNAALDNLKKIYSFDDEQATAVANMHFYSLNDEDKEKLEDEYEKDKAVYDQFGLILSDQKNLIQYARQELKDIFNKYFKKDKRRTEISTETDDRDTIPDYNVMIAYTHNGYIKSVKLDEYNVQARNGKGSAFKTKEDDFVESLHALSTRDNLVFIMSSGRAVILPAYKIPTLSKNSIGKPVENYINLHIDANNRVVNIFVLTEDDRKNGDKQLFLFTRKGYGKKMTLSDLPKSTQGASIIKFDEDDSLVSACLLDKNCDIATITTKGMGGRFSSDSIMAHGRNSYGSRIMKLSKDDETVAAFAVNESDDIIMFASDGYAKRFHASKLRQVSRGFKGVKCGFDNHGKIISAVGIKDTDECMLVSKEGQLIRIPVSDFSAHGRTSNGVRAINLEEGDEIVSALVLEPENPVDDNQEDKEKEVTDNAKEEETKAAG